MRELKILQVTAKVFQLLVQEESIQFDAYKRHHSKPILIIEQLLMNSHIDLCSKTIKLCRDSLGAGEPEFMAEINEILVKYARKALEFKAYPQQQQQLVDQTLKQRVVTSVTSGGGGSGLFDSGYDTTAKRSSLIIPSSTKPAVMMSKGRKSGADQIPIMNNQITNSSVSPNINIIASSSPSSFSSSFKNFYKIGSGSQSASNTANQTFSTNGYFFFFSALKNKKSILISKNLVETLQS